MGQYNQDYFKVAGQAVSDNDQASASKALLTHERATLRREAPPPRRASPKPGSNGHAGTTHTHQTSPEAPVAKTGSNRIRAPASKASAFVQQLRADKVQHGKKRRSTRKRHAVDVARELRTHPNLTPAEAAYDVRHERPPAEVIDVREGARRRALRAGAKSGREAAPTALPNAPPSEGAIGAVQRLYRQGRSRVVRDLARVVHVVAEVLAFPLAAFDVIHDIRRRDT